MIFAKGGGSTAGLKRFREKTQSNLESFAEVYNSAYKINTFVLGIYDSKSKMYQKARNKGLLKKSLLLTED